MTTWIAAGILLTLLLILIVLFRAVTRWQSDQSVPRETLAKAATLQGFENAIEQALSRLSDGVKHHVEVSAVLAILDKFDGRPELIERLAAYSDQVVAAALLFRINNAAANLKRVLEDLHTMRGLLAGDTTSQYYQRQIRDLEEARETLTEQLFAAHQEAQTFSSRHASS